MPHGSQELDAQEIAGDEFTPVEPSTKCGGLGLRDDELHHRDVSLAQGAELAPANEALTAAVKAGTRVAIWLAKRI